MIPDTDVFLGMFSKVLGNLKVKKKPKLYLINMYSWCYCSKEEKKIVSVIFHQNRINDFRFWLPIFWCVMPFFFFYYPVNPGHYPNLLLYFVSLTHASDYGNKVTCKCPFVLCLPFPQRKKPFCKFTQWFSHLFNDKGLYYLCKIWCKMSQSTLPDRTQTKTSLNLTWHIIGTLSPGLVCNFSLRGEGFGTP